MKNVNDIKERLSKIQVNFNPEKKTYKIMQKVIDEDLSYSEMLMELSKITGINKYPEDVKNEYLSIIDDIKELSIEEKKKAEKKKQDQNTRELKSLIDSLEKREVDVKKLDSIVEPEHVDELHEEEVSDIAPVEEETSEEKEEQEEKEKEEKETKKVNDSKYDDEDDNYDYIANTSMESNEDESEHVEESKSKVHIFLLIGILFVIMLIALVLFLY